MFFAAFVIVFLVTWAVVYASMPAARGIVSFLARAVVRNARVAKLVDRHGQRLRDYWPVVALLVAGATLTVWAGDGFIDLAEMAHARRPPFQQPHPRVHDAHVARRG